MAAGIETRHGPHGTRYRASVWSGQHGKLIRKTFTSIAEAKRWRVDAAQALQHGTLHPPSSQTVREAAEAWIDGARDGTIRNRSGRPFKPSTVRGYERTLRLRVYPTLGHARLSDVRRRDIQDLVVPPASPAPFGGAWTRLASPAMLANALALAALPGLPATPSRSPKRASTYRRNH